MRNPSYPGGESSQREIEYGKYAWNTWVFTTQYPSTTDGAVSWADSSFSTWILRESSFDFCHSKRKSFTIISPELRFHSFNFVLFLKNEYRKRSRENQSKESSDWRRRWIDTNQTTCVGFQMLRSELRFLQQWSFCINEIRNEKTRMVQNLNFMLLIYERKQRLVIAFNSLEKSGISKGGWHSLTGEIYPFLETHWHHLWSGIEKGKIFIIQPFFLLPSRNFIILRRCLVISSMMVQSRTYNSGTMSSPMVLQTIANV